MKEKFEKEKKAIEEGYVNSFLSSFKENKWSKYEESGTQYMHHPTVKPKMILCDFNNIVIPFVYDGSDVENSEFSKSRGIWVERRNKFYQDYSQDENLKWNFHSLTIYPSGEYESEFIWDNEAYLEKLVFKAENLFSLLYYEISSCPAFYNAREEQISWQEAIVTVLFKSGKVQPLNVEVKTATNEIVHYSEAIEEEFGESEYQSSRQYYEETYHLMNEGELKALYQRWNVATIHIKYGVRFDFEKHVILEWKEENA